VPLIHWVGRGTGTPKDKDEVNKQEVCECEGWVWDLDAIGDPSRLRLIRKVTDLASRFPLFDLRFEKNAARRKWKNSPLVDCASGTPEAEKKRSVSRWACKNKSLINSLCNLPDVLAIAGIKDTTLELIPRSGASSNALNRVSSLTILGCRTPPPSIFFF
jgi:hypothetical protein